MRPFISILLLCFVGIACHTNHSDSRSQDHRLIHSFDSLSSNPIGLSFSNALKPSQAGGHLQGIQAHHWQGKSYLLFSGSSDTEAYLAVALMDSQPHIATIHQLLPSPFKHAGGFQIHGQYMGIGIEDNEAKDKSRVCLYELTDPLQLPAPRKIIERQGQAKRATAGCIALTVYEEHLLIYVGDWDTKHIDVYRCPLSGWNDPSIQPKLMTSIDTDTLNTDRWINDSWLSYQNINLIAWENQLYLVGFGFDALARDVADFFLVEEQHGIPTGFQKIARKRFQKKDGTHFRWGAGLEWNPQDGITRVLSCTEQLGSEGIVNEYRNSIRTPHPL